MFVCTAIKLLLCEWTTLLQVCFIIVLSCFSWLKCSEVVVGSSNTFFTRGRAEKSIAEKQQKVRLSWSLQKDYANYEVRMLGFFCTWGFFYKKNSYSRYSSDKFDSALVYTAFAQQSFLQLPLRLALPFISVH